MEIVSTSKLVPSETEKATTICNFQTTNSFVMSRDLMRVRIKIITETSNELKEKNVLL